MNALLVGLGMEMALAFALVFMGMPSLIQVARMKNLMDEPGDDRKVHRKSVPTVGGLMVFAGLAFSILVILPEFQAQHPLDFRWSYVLAALVALFFIGLKDDIVGLSPSKKLAMHVVLGLMLIMAGDFRIGHFGGLFGLEALPYAVSVGFSLFVYIVVVNAINLIDGVDGLAGGYGFLSMLAMAVWFAVTGQGAFMLLAAGLAGALLGFLAYNFQPAKIFLGDCGSLPIGMVAYVMATGIIGTPVESLPDWYAGGSTVVLAMCVLAYPLVDTLRVFILRALRGQSPFNPDRNHIHHRLMMLGWNHARVSVALYFYTALFLALPVVLVRWTELSAQWIFFLLLPLAFFIFQPALGATRRRALRDRAMRERGQQLNTGGSPVPSSATPPIAPSAKDAAGVVREFKAPSPVRPATQEELQSALATSGAHGHHEG
ncbi:MAG: hypothetical protein RJA19_1196 [Bacteroidota bacterium]|jgi:UDP-N-acetylmuramyl pentapeptide phosphotransferase/UDP-N-acetylglucosamine-1-phosphate transferase